MCPAPVGGCRVQTRLLLEPVLAAAGGTLRFRDPVTLLSAGWLSTRPVIFPQIVRTDLKELRDFNLDGAPYGYTPFCDSRREMDGYRFWKSGYWASHLAGRKYHIR